jgi:L-threonylcarbamoyladenylate synthase
MKTIQTLTISANQTDATSRALDVLNEGGLVAFPTDTVYGVGALAFDAEAVESIYTAKNRPVEKAIPILIGGPEDLDKVTAEIPPMAAKLAARFWPGPLTLVVPKHPNLPDVVSASPTVGVRVPDHPVVRALLRAAGPMAVTSANISGQDSPKTAGDVSRQLNGRIPLILDGGEAPGGVPSTVVNCLGTEPVILREGPVRLKDIQFVLA